MVHPARHNDVPIIQKFISGRGGGGEGGGGGGGGDVGGGGSGVGGSPAPNRRRVLFFCALRSPSRLILIERQRARKGARCAEKSLPGGRR